MGDTVKKIGLYNYYETYNNNNLFRTGVSQIGDDLTYPFRYLKERAESQRVEVSTIDTGPLESFDRIIFLDFPTLKNKYFQKLMASDYGEMYLFIFENELIRPDNWDTKNYHFFKKVYTWNDKLVDNQFIYKFFLPNKIPDSFSFDFSKKTRFCCLIAGNKLIRHPLELYSERIRAIRWFEQNAPNDFDLYGFGWDEPVFTGVFSPLNRFAHLRKTLLTGYPSFRGRVESKMETMRNYKFSICYENARDIPGYITEKIFDCFFAGCVPIYWGAPNVTDYVSAGTFIDRREFNSYSQLFDFLKTMKDERYLGYIEEIEGYLKSEKIYPFSAENFAETILNLV